MIFTAGLVYNCPVRPGPSAAIMCPVSDVDEVKRRLSQVQQARKLAVLFVKWKVYFLVLTLLLIIFVHVKLVNQ